MISAALLLGVAGGTAAAAVAFAAREIMVGLSGAKGSIWFFIIVFVLASFALFYFSFRRYRHRIHILNTGLHGEQAVAFVLKDLERQGFSVFHDVPSLNRPEEANIDHVVIGPTGVYAIETKTIRKRGGQHSLEFTGESLAIDGKSLPQNPIPQARAVAEDLANIMNRFAGEKRQIQAVVVLPGWYVTSKFKPWKQPVWVVNENALVSLITSPYRPATPEDMIHKLSGALQTHIRASRAAKQ